MPVERAAMKVSRIAFVCLCGLATLCGCAKTEDEPAQANSKAATQPTATALTLNTDSAEPAPTASMMMIDRAQQWFGPARLRLTTSNGKVIARLYSDDPKDVLSGKETVNSFDMKMQLDGIADPADIAKAVWINRSSSMDRQDTPYGIFLDNQHEILQPMNVTISFQGKSPRVKAIVQGTFGLFHISDQMPHPAPVPVSVVGILDATVVEGK
jgi:hypothetical protein